ncbi:hypothetical protein [Kitasatospora sp. NPDC087314]|uniref:hypothetical protein n=1 Tax=Kitasatospora sp. NPDC087314 TaxID=3364068 RepID=UPI0038297853
MPVRSDRSSSTRESPPPRPRTGPTSASPIHRDSDGKLRASAGWLLEFVGCRPGQPIAEGVRCSKRRTLTITAHGQATAAGFDQTLANLSTQVATATEITLQPEPTRVGRWVVSP